MKERTREINRSTSEARNRAMYRLKAAHPEEFRRYYNEELVARGITPRGTREEQRAAKAARLRAEADELEGRS